MTTTSTAARSVDSAAAPQSARRLTAPLLLRLDAALCALTGLLLAVDAGPVADLLGPDVATASVRAVGIGLVVWAADLAVAGRLRGRWLVRAGVAAGLINLGWVLGTLVLVATGAFSVLGTSLALAVAVVVGAVGVLQLRARRG